MQNISAPQWDWDNMLKVFRALGGTAQNLVFREGALGRGLFPVDPSRPVLLRLPRNLLFRVDEVEFAGERMMLKPTANVGQAERMFFEGYENAFSWGGGGRTESVAFIAALDLLPADVRDRLSAEFGFESLLNGDPIERAGRRFLGSRYIRLANEEFVMPLIELTNHDPGGLPFQTGAAGLHIEGKVSGEVLTCYGAHDAFSIFHTFGFANREPGSFSLGMKLEWEGMNIMIERNPARPEKRGKDWIPQLTSNGNTHTLSFLMIGHPKYPRLSRGAFSTLMRQVGMKNRDEAFDRILRFNWMRYLRLLEVLEPYEGEMIVTLRKVVRYQLEAMCHCIGSREPEAEVLPAGQVWSLSAR
jgi:hypothetical protein